MSLSKRLIVFSILLLSLLFVWMLFGLFILDEIIRPVTLAVWLLLRIFVLSIGQQYYWGALIFVLAIFLFRLFPQNQESVQAADPLDSNATMRAIGYWRALFTLTNHDLLDEKTLKRDLAQMMISLYATKQGTAANYEIFEALQRGEIPIPAPIHTYLFREEPDDAKHSLKKILQTIQNAPRKWIRRWTGQDTAEHYGMIDEVLSFIETSLENRKDDGKSNPNQH